MAETAKTAEKNLSQGHVSEQTYRTSGLHPVHRPHSEGAYLGQYQSEPDFPTMRLPEYDRVLHVAYLRGT